MHESSLSTTRKICTAVNNRMCSNGRRKCWVCVVCCVCVAYTTQPDVVLLPPVGHRVWHSTATPLGFLLWPALPDHFGAYISPLRIFFFLFFYLSRFSPLFLFLPYTTPRFRYYIFFTCSMGFGNHGISVDTLWRILIEWRVFIFVSFSRRLFKGDHIKKQLLLSFIILSLVMFLMPRHYYESKEK